MLHAARIVSLVLITLAALAHHQSKAVLLPCDVGQVTRCLWFFERQPLLDKVDVLIILYAVLADVFVEVVYPLVAVGRLDFQRAVDHVFVLQAFSVDPGVGVVELEHVDAFPHGIDAVLYFARLLLLGQQQGLALLLAAHLSHVVQPQRHVQTLHHYSVVKDRVFFQNLEIAAGAFPALEGDAFADSDSVIGHRGILRIAYQRLLVHCFD